MSAAMQFSGPVSRKRGFGLVFYLATGQYGRDVVEEQTCAQCGQSHPVIYRAWRKPAGTWGCWVVFRYNGEEHVPDMSIPIAVNRLPRGAQRLDTDAAARYWHS